jgi:Cft2 family RNA processing exonuclease
MQLTVQGAAREVTGSCHVVQARGKTILFDR